MRSDEIRPGVHRYRAVCGYNASLSIEWGRVPPHQEERIETEWSKKFPDHEIRVEEFDVLLNGAVIYRLTIANVVGYRCWILFPSPMTEGEGYEVTSWETSVVGLANALVHGSTDTLEYVKLAGINVIPRPPLDA